MPQLAHKEPINKSFACFVNIMRLLLDCICFVLYSSFCHRDANDICTKNKNGLITIWLTLSLTFRVYFFHQMFSSARPQTFKVQLLKLKAWQKSATVISCAFPAIRR